MKPQLLQDIIQWDVQAWSKAIHYWDGAVDWPKVATCLELGAREGGISLWLAMKGKQVICSDLANAKTTAETLHIRYGVIDKIEYEDINATGIPYENYFDVIIFKSVLGGIGRNDNYAIQQQVLNEIYKALKPGGSLLFAENLRASLLHSWFRKIFQRWGNTWRYLSRNELQTLMKQFASVEIKTTGFLSVFGRNEKQRTLLARADQMLFNKIVPKSWNYIAYGVAKK